MRGRPITIAAICGDIPARNARALRRKVEILGLPPRLEGRQEPRVLLELVPRPANPAA